MDVTIPTIDAAAQVEALMNERELPEFLSPREIADLLNISQSGVYMAIRRGKIESFKINTSRRIHRDQVLRWVRESNLTPRAAE